MIEPENDELVQVSYLCDMDSQIWEDELLNEPWNLSGFNKL